VFGKVEDLGEAGIFIPAQRRVDAVIADDPGFPGIVADGAQGGLAQLARPQ
jgi:hypothetical protein